MTNEEAKRIAIGLRTDFKCESDTMVDFCNTVIKALEQEPCEDAISRKVLISHIENQSREWGEDYDAQQILGDIEDLPPVNPQEPKWIPCSERLPEEGESVLTQAMFKDDLKMAVSSRVDYNYWTGWGTRDINIVAWMPLPEPYMKGGEADG